MTTPINDQVDKFNRFPLRGDYVDHVVANLIFYPIRNSGHQSISSPSSAFPVSVVAYIFTLYRFGHTLETRAV